MKLKEMLLRYKFIEAGYLSQVKDVPIFILNDNFLKDGSYASIEGWVYLWVGCKVSSDQKSYDDIFYVGKAGKRILDRCRQHRNGFVRAKGTADRNAKNIISYLQQNSQNTILLLVRHSELRSVLGEKTTSMCCAEEVALINKFRALGYSLWNK